MEKVNETLELQEMHDQLNLLNRKLEKEHIVNEQIFRRTMNRRISGFKQERWATLLIPPIVIPCLIVLYKYMHLSLAFILVTTLLITAAVAFTFYEWRNIHSDDFLAGNLCDTSKKLVRIEQMNSRWILFYVPVFVLWIIWFLLEAYWQSGTGHIAPGLWGGVGGALGGSIVGAFFYRSRKKAINETIRQIEDFTKE